MRYSRRGGGTATAANRGGRQYLIVRIYHFYSFRTDFSKLLKRAARTFPWRQWGPKRQKTGFFQSFYSFQNRQKPLYVGEQTKVNTTCCGDKKFFKKSYAIVILCAFFTKITPGQWLERVIPNGSESSLWISEQDF